VSCHAAFRSAAGAPADVDVEDAGEEHVEGALGQLGRQPEERQHAQTHLCQTHCKCQEHGVAALNLGDCMRRRRRPWTSHIDARGAALRGRRHA
jgi:hypothetical protein